MCEVPAICINHKLTLMIRDITSSSPHFFLVSMTVNVLLQCFHPLKRLFIINAIDEDKTICKSVVMSRKLHSITKTAGVIKANLLSCTTICLYRANIDILQGLHGLRT